MEVEKGTAMTQLIRTPKQLGALVHNARTHRNLTQQALADLVGTGQKTVSRIENGHEGTRLDTLFAIVAALDLDLQLGPRSKGGKNISEIF
jgi:HTH-type transcriptional regulator/antitoxin HipB